jgi:tRNA dimethylallyltransferase
MADKRPPDPARPILIAGPTASGKSGLALTIAAELAPATIVNVDSMQVYTEIPILSARPSAEEQERAPHRLYGHVPAREAYSAGRFVREAAVAIGEARAAGRRPILVGGTGLYFKALLEGLSPIPDIPDEIRSHWRAIAAAAQPGELHTLLATRDPASAARLLPADTQRLVRALEVIEATGQSLTEWQGKTGQPVLRAEETVRLVLRPQRAELHARADARLEAMFAAGAVEEVEDLKRLQLDPALPAMRALGVRPLLRHLDGEIDRAAALELAMLETRQYVKRQETWLSRHMIAWTNCNAQEMKRDAREIVALIHRSG